jgi:cation transport ATPase
MKNILAGLFVFIAANAFALDIITRDGKAYQDCAVKTVERDGVRVVHRDGTAFFDFDVLPSALQQQYGWTAEKAAARKAEKEALAEKQRVANEKERQARAESLAAEERAKEKQRVEIERQERAKAEERETKIQEQKEGAARMRMLRNVGLILTVILGLIVYFLPTIIGRKKANVGAIFVMNLLLGWLFIGWVIALVWACTKDVKPNQVTVVHNVYVQEPPHPRPVVVPRAVAKAIPPPRNPPS